MLAILGVRPGQAHSRSRLASLLWADVGEEQARHSVRQAVFSLRRMLPEDVLTTTNETIAMNPDAVAVDVCEFEQLAAKATPETLEQAARLYRGDLLDGMRLREPGFEEWLTRERDRLRSQAVEVLHRLTAMRVEDGSLETAIASASRLVMLDPTRETTHRTLIRLYLDTGRRDAAVRQYHACERVLARELGMRPDAETRALYDKILASRAVTAPAANGRLTPAAVLIVEDEPVTRTLLEGILRTAGYDITAVTDGADALAHLNQRHVDLILSDIALPRLDGLSLARKALRAN
ncbi:MAG: hypothetical protein DME02_25255 [Candidatus Rokuibacteriota bacterium]|nr:MAG: hypothetical protein DME02_25255 [Candidatus Rokubacteria bacterium]